MLNSGRKSDLLKGVLAGLIGGLVGGWAMNKFQDAWSELTGDEGDSEMAHSPKQSGRPESIEQVRDAGGKEDTPANVKMASAISESVFDHRLATGEKIVAGTAVHYAFSAVAGAAYGAVVELKHGYATGAGAPFGAAVWVIADQAMLPALGLSKSAAGYPLSKHAYSLAAHIVYGTATEAARRLARRALNGGL